MDKSSAKDYLPWLEMKNIEAWVGGNRVFNDLNLNLLNGQNTVVLGPNGSGKSSLIKLISRELYPVVKENSSFRLFGSATIDLIKIRKRIGILTNGIETRTPQECVGRDIILSGFLGSIGINKREFLSESMYTKLEEIIKLMSLEAIAYKSFRELSDGQKRRLLLARTLINNPDILILDEPTNAIDLKAKHQLLASFRKLCKNGKTILLVTHQIDNVIKEFNRIVLMKNGKIIEDGKPFEILRSDLLSDLFETPLEVICTRNHWQILPAKTLFY